MSKTEGKPYLRGVPLPLRIDRFAGFFVPLQGELRAQGHLPQCQQGDGDPFDDHGQREEVVHHEASTSE